MIDSLDLLIGALSNKEAYLAECADDPCNMENPTFNYSVSFGPTYDIPVSKDVFLEAKDKKIIKCTTGEWPVAIFKLNENS